MNDLIPLALAPAPIAAIMHCMHIGPGSVSPRQCPDPLF
jgi:hypothetical protein